MERSGRWTVRRALAILAVLLAAGAATTILLTRAVRSGRQGAPLPPPAAARPSAPVSPPARPLRASPPVRLEIPRIGVDAAVMSLGLNPDRSLEVPPLSRAQEAGWYRLGPVPGATGAAVIAGHVDTTRGPAVFFRLGALRPGDVVRVGRRDGTTATFRVDSVEAVPKTAFPTQKVYGRVGYPALRLITCGGTFDHGTGHYDDNVIVYGHLI
ncbi:class F sortase [Actinoallomurus soli]|uniref:class F sortase n=1 Tax=Actinoallomurus soli TaxID=2952535 RepID=UPI0020925F69|nr:class F sortase [Actinoallomurus soli]MCO5972272.1 class F sortase [Actinoallomurus soli]